METLAQKMLQPEPESAAPVPVRKVPLPPPLKTIEEVGLTPEEARRSETGTRNARWFNDHALELEVFTRYRGKNLVVAGGELFVADTFLEAYRAARAKYPDECPFWDYIPAEKRVHTHAS